MVPAVHFDDVVCRVVRLSTLAQAGANGRFHSAAVIARPLFVRFTI